MAKADRVNRVRKTLMAVRALHDDSSPDATFTTADVARRLGITERAGSWTRETREYLFALYSAQLVAEPEGRPHRWHLTPSGFSLSEML